MVPVEYSKPPNKAVTITGAPSMSWFTSTTFLWPSKYARPMAGVAKVDMPNTVRIRMCPATLVTIPTSAERRLNKSDTQGYGTEDGEHHAEDAPEQVVH